MTKHYDTNISDLSIISKGIFGIIDLYLIFNQHIYPNVGGTVSHDIRLLLIFRVMLPDYNLITRYISSPRLSKYELVCDGNTRRVLKLYQTNLRLSQAFYPLLSLFEVILRNAINEELALLFKDSDWLTSQQKGFMIDKSLTYYDIRQKRKVHNHFMKFKVAEVINDLGASTTQGKIISNLSLGFWTAFFDRNHYKILTGQPIKIFSFLPPGTNRNIIHTKLKRINDFRNRVYHNEAIIFGIDSNRSLVFDLKQSNEIYNDINDLFSWLGLDYKSWTKRIDNVQLEIERADRVYNCYPDKKYYLYRIILGLSHYKRKYL